MENRDATAALSLEGKLSRSLASDHANYANSRFSWEESNAVSVTSRKIRTKSDYRTPPPANPSKGFHGGLNCKNIIIPRGMEAMINAFTFRMYGADDFYTKSHNIQNILWYYYPAAPSVVELCY